MRRDLRVLKSILPGWAIAFLRRLRNLLRRGRQLRLHTPRARREAALQELQALAARPLISLVMPTYKTDLKYLREAVDSVLGQHYPEWELIVVDDASGDPALERALNAYAGAHAQIKYRQLSENSGISAATNAGMELVEGEFVGFLDHDDTLTPDALLRVAQALAADPELDVVYSDSDKLTIGGVRADPFLKPDWSPVYALGAMYIGHLLVVRTSVAEAAGGFDPAFDKIQDFEFMLRVSERTGRIHHIPQILYHWRAIPGSIAAGTEQKSGVEDLQARAVSAHLERLGLPARAVPHAAIPHRAVLEPANGSAPRPKVSVVVHARGAVADLKRLQRSLEKTDYPDFETILVPEGSRAEAHNAGAAQAAGEYLVFLAPDTEIVDPGWLTQLVLHAALPDVAAVGPKLVRPDGKVEQAGIAIGLRDPAAPMLAGVAAEGDGYYGALPCSREVSGLSAECMLVARGDFEREGGFLDLYAHEYEDLDLCRRLARSGRKCVYAATATVLTHRGEAARRAGSDIVDRALFVDTWYDELLAGDPYFNRGFARQRADYVPSGWLEPVHRAVGAMRAR
ncbi:MAG TPA: glycosyltransferase [Solirubrobacterales bacterium]|nr:glycosyltransferase [Solirubrobacterales bacterium]